jgi:ferric-dicitrate binding protein FerR (iron transport regulator)
VLAAATTAFEAKTARRRERLRFIYAGAAATLVFAVALMMRWTPPVAERDGLAEFARTIGSVEVATGDLWRPAAKARMRLTAGIRIRTLDDGRAALALAGGESLRIAPATEVMLDGPRRFYVSRGTVYVDSGGRPAASRVEVVTPAGTARDVGTQFELHVEGTRLRLRVREGSVVVDRGGQSLTGHAGEQLSIDDFGGVAREPVSADADVWQWAEGVAPVPDIDGKPATQLIAWAARETGRRVRYESPLVEQRAARVILHGRIENLAPLAALEAMLATTDLEYVLEGDTMEIRVRDTEPPGP